MAKASKLDKVRNLGVVAHIDAGKTTVTERFLFYCGPHPQDWRGPRRRHADGLDARGARARHHHHRRGDDVHRGSGHELHLIDTPGHVDFTIEVERSLRVLDGAVVVFSAVDGVEPQSETVWHQADKFHVPRVAFINKMDRIGADWRERASSR